MIAPQPYTARLEDKQVLNDKFILFKFELVEPEKLEFTAGQYVSLKVDPAGHRRSYSICSSPAIQHGFELLVDITPQGLGSVYLQNLQLGDQVEVLAPLGRFTVPQAVQPTDPLMFIAAGSGVTPFRSMILDLLQNKHATQPMQLYWGMRYAQSLIWLDEFQELEESFKNFSLHLVLSRAPEDWTLCRGRVTDCLSVHAQPPNAWYFLCGNDAMIKDTSHILTQLGVAAEHIVTEKFF